MKIATAAILLLNVPLKMTKRLITDFFIKPSAVTKTRIISDTTVSRIQQRATQAATETESNPNSGDSSTSSAIRDLLDEEW